MQLPQPPSLPLSANQTFLNLHTSLIKTKETERTKESPKLLVVVRPSQEKTCNMFYLLHCCAHCWDLSSDSLTPKSSKQKEITKKRAEMKRQRELVPWELLQSVLQGKCRNTLLSSRLQLAGVLVTFLPETQPLLVVTAGLQASPTRFPSSHQSHFASVLSRLWKSSLEA